MSPKEKAIELLDNFRLNVIDYEGSGMNAFDAKQCALIVADEVLGYMGADRGTEFWLEVKSEIKKL